MSSLVTEKIILEQNVGHESIQVLLEGDIIVPDVKPDMSVVLQTDVRVYIDKTEASTDRVNFMGKMELHVLYLAKGPNKTVQSMGCSTALDDFINMEGVNRDMWVDAKAEIANIDYKMLNDRKINYRAVINVTVSANNTYDREIVINVNDIPENQLLKTNLTLNRSIENKTDRFVVGERITLPSGKPNIREILQLNAAVGNREARITNGRVNIVGELVVTTLYKADNSDSLIEFIENEIPFNGTIEVPGARDDMFADVVLNIVDQYAEAQRDDDGEDRVISVDITVGAVLKVYCQDTREILEDAYDINKTLNVSKTPVKYPKLICRNKNQSTLKEIIQLDDSCPDILQIFKVVGTPRMDDLKIIEDKVIVEGIVETNVLYVAASDETPLYSYTAAVPYKQFIETKGALPSMNAGIDITIEHVGFNMLSGRELEVRLLLSFNIKVTEEKCIDVITNIEFDEMDKLLLDNMASMTVYVVQCGDTLWKIAKKYNTSLDELLAVNEIENPNKIYPGQKLLILKKII